MISYHTKTAEAAKGKWRGVLLELGVPDTALRDKHGPCPMCGGKDRFRWDNKDGRGSYICGHCGAGDGMKLAMEFTGLAFQEVASRIDEIVGNIKPDAGKRVALTDDERRQALRSAWAATKPMQPGDLADTYLRSRGLGETVYPPELRFGAALKDGEGGVRPCMVATVGVYGEKPVNLHRTFLRPDGKGKAEMAAPRKMMPGTLPDGACIQLSEWTGSGPLGIAEGIETAMAASRLFDMPVWSAINTSIMSKWWLPEGCEEVAIFGDNDPAYGGQAAAYVLAHRLAAKCISVTVHIPDQPGLDWNDILQRKPAS